MKPSDCLTDTYLFNAYIVHGSALSLLLCLQLTSNNPFLLLLLTKAKAKTNFPKSCETSSYGRCLLIKKRIELKLMQMCKHPSQNYRPQYIAT